MNVAVFFELGGDSTIDYEVWANLSRAGWGTAYFDNGSGEARYAAEDQVGAAVEEGRLFLRFPLEHLGSATTLRWSMASEWGRYEEIGSPTMARDYLPDDRHGRPFPG